jgi:hypothetical protein
MYSFSYVLLALDADYIVVEIAKHVLGGEMDAALRRRGQSRRHGRVLV